MFELGDGQLWVKMRVLAEKVVLVLLVCDGGRVDVTVVNHHLLIVYGVLGYTRDMYLKESRL